jgi:hypothetical protein
MAFRLLIKFFIILALMGMLFPVNPLAQQAKFSATIYTVQGKPIPVEDFHLVNGNFFYDAVQNGKDVKLPFENIKTIQFINPGKNYEADITLNDGKKNRYSLKKPGNIEIITKFSKVSMGHTKVTKIEFGALQKKQEPEPVEKLEKVDRIILKNGDNLSGQLQTNVFTLKTSYGTFNFEAPKVSYIDFDTKDKDIDVVVLKIGDRLSGVIEVKSVKFLLRSGKEVSFEGEAIKKIMINR